jgi:DNA-binding beta-propeller fold protein YncE
VTSPDGTRIYAIASRLDEGHASGTAVWVLALDPVSRSVVDSVQISRPADLGTQPIDISLSSGGGSLYVSVNRTDPGDLPDLTTLVQVGTLLTIDIATFTVVDEISELQLIFGFGITPDQETGYFSGIQDLNDPTFRIFVVDMLQGELLSQLPVAVNSGAEFLFTTAKQAVRSALTYLELSLF